MKTIRIIGAIPVALCLVAAAGLLIGCQGDPAAPGGSGTGGDTHRLRSGALLAGAGGAAGDEIVEEVTEILPPPHGGFRGTVAEAPLRQWGPVIAGATLRFTPEHGGPRLRVVSGADGRYTAALRPGRYHVLVERVGYETYSTCAGFFVVRDGWETGNVFLYPEGTCRCAEDGTIDGHPDYDPSAHVDAAPAVSIAVDPPVACRGQVVTVTVSATDDVGLDSIWWGLRLGCAPEMPPVAPVQAGGARSLTRQWRFTARTPGRHVLFAQARDTAYPTLGEPHQASEGAGMGCAELVILRLPARPIGDRR